MPSKSFPIFGGTFTFRLIPTIITLLMMLVLVGLGYWQVQRLHWKQGLIAEINDRTKLWAVDVGLSVIPPETVPMLDYRHGKAAGLFQHDHELYLNATSVGTGDGGYDLLTPLLLEDGRTLLVNRGWVPYSKKQKSEHREWKAEDQDPQYGVYRPVGPTQVTGMLRLPPDKKPPARPDNDPGKNDWYWVDLPAMAQAAGVKEFMPYILEAEDAPHDGNYPVGGQTRIELPNHHFQYALTWFWLAFILPGIYFVSSWRKDAPKKVEESEKSGESKPE